MVLEVSEKLRDAEREIPSNFRQKCSGGCRAMIKNKKTLKDERVLQFEPKTTCKPKKNPREAKKEMKA